VRDIKDIGKLPRGKHFVGGSLCVFVHRNGSRYWRFKYHWGGKETQVGLGKWPEVSIEEARERHRMMRDLMRRGINPADYRRQVRAAKSNITWPRPARYV